jgi:hypothetical protein
LTPNIGLTTVVATLVHSSLFALSVAMFARHHENRQEAQPTVENPSNGACVASGIETDPASGANRAPAPTATDAQFRATETLMVVDLAPSSPEAAPGSPNDISPTKAVFPPSEDGSGTPAQPLEQPSRISNVAADQSPQGLGGRGGGRSGGLRARPARSAKHRDSLKTPNEPIEIDMGQPGGVDALLFGEGSPGLSHDLSSAPRIGGRVYWECPWPSAAARAGVNHAVVHVTVDVTARGGATAAQLIDQPGYEFGEDAIRCAMDQRYIPGRDASGKPVAGRTRKFSVQFNRRGMDRKE